ncbi:MAG: response regulator transcription factor [Roseburia sp.]|jgi:two-component system alkaline phosphatase synthesis response regulator PhoP|nr:response regulator transcription factor [Roseburia sp.]
MKSVYVVEDDANIREIELFALKNSGYRTEGFESASDFLKSVARKKPSLILLDLMLPDMDGITVLARLRANPDTRNLPIILVTARTTELDKVKGLDAGADDYITKPFGVMELISRVKALLRRTEPEKEEKPLVLGDIRLSAANRSCEVAGTAVDLTYKEFELLSLLLQNAGLVLTRDVLMEKIWGTDFAGESRTLDMHIKTLRQKLGAAGSRIKTVRNVGYLADQGGTDG